MNVRAGRRDEMIYLRDYIGGSAVRECYRHPLFEDKCVKVVKDKKDLPGLLREVRVSKLVAPYLEDYIVEYEDELVETNRGPGLVCGLVRNDCDGAVAPALAHYQEGGVELGGDIERGLREILRRLIAHNLFFYDFNKGNFVVKETRGGGKQVVFIDLKGFHKNGYMGFLKLERFIAPMARNIMFRRMRRLYRELKIDEFPLNGLCREKMFSSFWVDVKL